MHFDQEQIKIFEMTWMPLLAGMRKRALAVVLGTTDHNNQQSAVITNKLFVVLGLMGPIVIVSNLIGGRGSGCLVALPSQTPVVGNNQRSQKEKYKLF